MADLEEMTPGQILADTNVAIYIRDLGLGIAAAQTALDANSINTAVALATTRPEFSNRSLLELGFSPTFYHYQYADLEVSLQITLRVERSLSVRVGFNVGGSYSAGNSTTAPSTATITVRSGTGAPATGVVRLSQAGPGELVVGATTLRLVNGTATDPNVAVVANSLSRTARALADQLERSSPSDPVPEIRRATIELVAGGTAITPTTDASSVFSVGPNRIEIMAAAARPARAWVTVTAAGSIQLVGSDQITYTATPSAPEAAQTAIDAHASYTATLLFSGGKSRNNPRFAHNSAQNFETTADEDRLAPWIDFLRANATIRAKVVGHADQSGEDARNDPLSRDRATRIRQYLIDHGVPATQLDPIEGRGEREPVAGHDRAAQADKRDPENRRVELHLVDAALGNVLLVETALPGVAQRWGSGRPSFSSGAGRLLAAQDGADAVAFTSETFVAVGTHTFYVNAAPSASPRTPNTVVTPGATAESGARVLADAIVRDAQVDAVAEGRVILLYPTGSHALIRMETLARDASANTLTLTATGSLAREAPFTGAASGAEPNAGDTVRIGTTTLTMRTGVTAGAQEFLKGTDAAGTARNLATAITAISGFSGSATAERVSVTGPGGTPLATSNPAAFELSASSLSGTSAAPGNPNAIQRREENGTIAAGLSLDVAYSRRFGVDVTGNSRISTRLVSLPAPVELLDEIRTYLNGNPPRPTL